MKRPELSIGEALVGLLEAYGVDTIFGIPGVHNVEMYRALPRSGMTHVLPRHEQGAGFMADGYARATGKPGVCFTITGPGLLNILTPMAQAWSDSSPLFVISSALDVVASAQGRGRLHEMIDQRAAAAAVTSMAMRAYTAQDVQDGVARAFAKFASERPRPAYLEIPLDVLSMESGAGWTKRALPSRPTASKDDVAEAMKFLVSAKHPMIVLGGGTLGAGEAALNIARKLNAPIFTTTAGKGAVPASDPLSFGYRLLQTDAQKALTESDCVLAVGTELAETDFWNTTTQLRNLIRVDLDPDVLAKPHAARLAIRADAGDFLERLARALTSPPQGLGKGEGNEPTPTTSSLPALQQGAGVGEVNPQLVRTLNTLRDSLPLEAVVASDMTQIAYAANEVFPVSHPRTWLHPVGFGTLGFALPAAIGAKLGVGAKPVVAMAGDYGFQYTMNELGTAVEHKLPIPILLWNNSALGQIRDDMVNKGIEPNAVTLRNPDFSALAKAYGANAATPSSLSELANAIHTALKADGPTVITMTPDMVR